jgi:hypothetical protein
MKEGKKEALFFSLIEIHVGVLKKINGNKIERTKM